MKACVDRIIERYVQGYHEKYGRMLPVTDSMRAKAEQVLEKCDDDIERALEYVDLFLGSRHDLAVRNHHAISYAPGLFDIIQAEASAGAMTEMMRSFPFLSSLDEHQRRAFLSHLTKKRYCVSMGKKDQHIWSGSHGQDGSSGMLPEV